jgi:hypothetical protein
MARKKVTEEMKNEILEEDTSNVIAVSDNSGNQTHLDDPIMFVSEKSLNMISDRELYIHATLGFKVLVYNEEDGYIERDVSYDQFTQKRIVVYPNEIVYIDSGFDYSHLDNFKSSAEYEIFKRIETNFEFVGSDYIQVNDNIHVKLKNIADTPRSIYDDSIVAKLTVTLTEITGEVNE